MDWSIFSGSNIELLKVRGRFQKLRIRNILAAQFVLSSPSEQSEYLNQAYSNEINYYLR